MRGQDLQKLDFYYFSGAAGMLFMINSIIVRVFLMRLGYYGVGMALLLAASVTGACVFVYQIAIDALSKRYEEIFDAQAKGEDDNQG